MKKNKKTKDIIIDGDHILFFVCESKIYKDGLEDAQPLRSSGLEDLTPYEEHFKRIVEEYVATAEIESICYNWNIGKVRVIMSDNTNFRYEIYPQYKAKRPPTPELRKRLKKWAMKEYSFVPNTEADDVVAHYVRKGGIGFTTDKDLYKGVAGKWYNCHFQHRCWVKTTEQEAERFFKTQVLAGDATDGIPSIDGVGLITAGKLLDKYGDSWDDIFSIFKDVNKTIGKPRKVSYGRDYALTMIRLVSMTQWSKKKGVVLWQD